MNSASSASNSAAAWTQPNGATSPGCAVRIVPCASMQMMASVDASTTLAQQGVAALDAERSRQRARHVCSSSERAVAATNVATSASANGAASSTTRARRIQKQQSRRASTTQAAATNAALLRQPRLANSNAQHRRPGARALRRSQAGRQRPQRPSRTVCVANACTTTPGSARYTGTVTMSPQLDRSRANVDRSCRAAQPDRCGRSRTSMNET